MLRWGKNIHVNIFKPFFTDKSVNRIFTYPPRKGSIYTESQTLTYSHNSCIYHRECMIEQCTQDNISYPKNP